uniref:Apyrase-like n=1 Tax=Nicotiana sylvestris TaxID=4096 RepID=A0A1U7W2I9_NICSY|nr:PREDICTED: apyrase-like [Nicotiana sylvestris]
MPKSLPLPCRLPISFVRGLTYAISIEQFENAPQNEDGEPYVQEKHLMSKDYNLYVHRASFCFFQGYYSYGGVNYKVKAPPSGTSLKKCRRLTRKALKIRAPCNYKNCTFNGVWNGGGGAGTKTVHVSSAFYGVGAQVGIVDSKFPSAIAKPIQYLNAAKVVCKTKAAEIKSIFPNTQDRNIPYLCIDLVYDYTLLVDGFGLNPYKDIIVMRDVKYKNYLVRAAWPLGCAIDLVSSSSKKTRISSY